MLRFLTAGESHGKGLTIIIEGVPAGLALSEDFIAVDLGRRQKGYGRGRRQKIEQDRAACTIIQRALTEGHAVVMGSEENGPGRGAGESRDDVGPLSHAAVYKVLQFKRNSFRFKNTGNRRPSAHAVRTKRDRGSELAQPSCFLRKGTGGGEKEKEYGGKRNPIDHGDGS